LSRQTLGPTQPPVKCVPGLFPGGRGVALNIHPIWCRQKRVDLYLYSPSGPSWPVLW